MREKIRLVSSAGTGHFYTTDKNKSAMPDKFEIKNILLAVTGGIAAYKSAEIVRNLKKLGSNVKVIMTKSSQEFITPPNSASTFR